MINKWKGLLLAGSATILSLAGSLPGCANETNRYTKELDLPEKDSAIVRQLEDDTDTKALLDETSYPPEEFQVSDGRQNFNEVVEKLISPRLVYLFMIDNFHYIPDPVDADYWQTPLETFNRKGGDCEDYAKFAIYCLAKNGYNACMIVMGRENAAHAIAVYTEDSLYYYLDSGYYFDSDGRINVISSTGFRTVDDLVKSRGYIKYQIYDPDP